MDLLTGMSDQVVTSLNYGTSGVANNLGVTSPSPGPGNGDVATVKDAANNLTTVVYDTYDRVSQIQFPLPTTGSNALSTTDYEGYGYDNNGNVTTKRRRSGDTVTLTYDALNRPVSEVFPAGATQNVYWGYDLLNRTLYARYASPTGPGSSWTYDALGRAVTATSGSRALPYQYDAASNRTRMTWPDTGANALYVAYVYDVLNRVTQIQENGATSGAGLLASYAYDSLGRRQTISRAGGSGASTGYSYDGASRLYTLAQNLAGSAAVTYTFGYNAASQILSRTVTNDAYTARPASIASAYTANGLNQYTGVTGVTSTYTAANAAVLTYDPTGALQTDTNAGTTTNFLYDGQALVGEYDNSGNILSRYVTGPGIDEPVTWYSGAGTSSRAWYAADNAGSVIATADQNANATATYTYGPYGEPITSAGAPAWGGSRYRYTGQIEIPEAQLYYYKARVYDPAMGRVYQTDPAGYSSGVNLYAYATNDPINENDPSGLESAPATPPVNCIECTPPSTEVEEITVTGQKQPPPQPSVQMVININNYQDVKNNGPPQVNSTPTPPPKNKPIYVPDPESRNPFKHADPQGRKDICALSSAAGAHGVGTGLLFGNLAAKKFGVGAIPFASELLGFLDAYGFLMDLSGEGCGKYAGE